MPIPFILHCTNSDFIHSTSMTPEVTMTSAQSHSNSNAKAKSSAKPKAAARKRGGYDFAETAALPQAARKQAKKATASAHRIASKTASAAKNNLDLGLASISRSASQAHHQ